jgi:hypothetical protein
MTYTEKSTQLALEASVAAQVLMGTTPGDCEFILLKPRMADASMLADLAARWPGRGLHSVGIIGLVGATPRWAFKEPLETEQVDALAGTFLFYLNALFGRSLAEQLGEAEIRELGRLWSLPDTRLN